VSPAALDDHCLAALRLAIDAAETLGIDVSDARAVLADAETRLGFPGDRAVVALVGGTGVGKSTLLNALAGREVSAASVRRPTTTTPVAWLPSPDDDGLEPVLDWLEVPAAARVRRRNAPAAEAETDPNAPAILDLPDLDSIEPEHRARVDELLPRVDAVVWVTDPEKYHDAVLHDEVLGRWLSRLGRQLVVVNKADRLGAADAERIRAELGRDVARMSVPAHRGGDGATPDVVLASAASRDIERVRAWLATIATEKQVARRRLVASIRATARSLADAAGIEPGRPVAPLLPDDARRAAANDAAAALLRVVDLPAAERQAVAATRARARARGAGPLGGITSRLWRWSGREARVADPAAFLARWRERGGAAPAAAAVRARLAEPLRAARPAIRRRLVEASDTGDLERRLAAAVDRTVAADTGTAPTSGWWTLLGIAQTLVTGALVLVAAWVVLWVLIRFPVDTVSVPVLGAMPVPFVALVLAVVLGYLVARLLGAHAGFLGRRWAAALARDIRDGVRRDIEAAGLGAIDAVDRSRRDLADAVRAIERCG
jgi:energy-coupling factor transporter ATP-binding protein EcfA2